MQQQATNSGAIGLLNNGIYANYNQSSSLNYPSPWLSLEKHLIPSSFKKAAELRRRLYQIPLPLEDKDRFFHRNLPVDRRSVTATI